eukprot:1160980-Pelagomonas_calceolata.AAC.4
MEDAAQKEEAAAEQQALPIFAKAVIEQAAGVLVPHRLPSIPETFTGLLHVWLRWTVFIKEFVLYRWQPVDA